MQLIKIDQDLKYLVNQFLKIKKLFEEFILYFLKLMNAIFQIINKNNFNIKKNYFFNQ